VVPQTTSTVVHPVVVEGESAAQWIPGDPAVARFTGEIDLGNARHLFASIDAEMDGETTVIVDLSAVSFIDSRGLAELVELSRRLELRLVAPAGSQPRRALDITALSRALPTFEDTHDAVTGR
jgi:anti-anti-sigma factor